MFSLPTHTMSATESKKLTLPEVLVTTSHPCGNSDCGSTGLRFPTGIISLDCAIAKFRGGYYDSKRISEMKDCGMFDETKSAVEQNHCYYIYLTKKIVELLENAWNDALMVNQDGVNLLVEAVSKEMKKELNA